ncbi:NUDIX hydrolase domain-like protein [Boletus reticuloceps]|uniref:NUDIX hydrolase domain-like protein n=1 Tax=Boletus reticuloceps TaxID=495285 RepID=A0A8I2YIH3_9AGAM|nr:NUDIX hydrolase domain-like protein [Boletus reticuloceps]
MYFRLKHYAGTWTRAYKPYQLHAGRANIWLLGPRVSETTTSCFRTFNTTGRHQLCLLSLVHSAINLALPFGPFDDAAITHRASCNAGFIPPEEEERLLPMFLRSTSLSSPIGFLRPKVVEEILKNDKETGKKSIWNVLRRPDDSPWAICFANHVADSETRTEGMHVVLERWKAEGLFPDILKGWSDETYPVYLPQQERPSTISTAFGIERAALPLFGFANFGCLLMAFYDCPATNKTMLWIPRRSLTKSTWPGRYDCTVGGGMGLWETPNETIIRECTEEASLPSDFVRKHARSTGMLNFTNQSPSKWILPGIYYLYELRLPNDGTIMPRTNAKDGEVDTFQLMDVEEVMQRLLQGQFKPSSAMALVDFCIRRGIITPDSNPEYLDVCLAMRRPVVLPLP